MQLLYPSFLWGLLAISIPIAIHLLQLRRPQRVLFTNTGFIREVELTTMRRRRLQELAVLCARVLAIVALVLLFCQPFIPVVERETRLIGNTVGVLVDNSGSMQVVGQSHQPLLQEALDGAKVLGKSYGPSAHFKLVGQRGTSLTQGAYELALANQLSAKKTVGWGATGVRDALQASQYGPLYLFSDFQKNETNAQLLQQIRREGEVVLVPQVARAVGNVYVDSVWLNDAFVRARTNMGLHIRLRNGGSETVVDCPIKVLLGTQQVATFQVTVATGQPTDVIAQLQLPDTKLALGKVVTGDSPVTFDNTYYFTMQPMAAIRVVEIGPEPATQQAYASEPLFDYSFARAQSLNYGELRQANLVLLREVPQVDAGLREALVGVVRRGGSVVVVPSASPASHTSYHELFRGLGIGGEQWESPAAGVPVRQEVAMPSTNNPFFKDVFGAQARQVVMPQVAPVLRLGRGGSDIMRLRDGDAYLAEYSSEAGRAYVFAAPFAKEYTDFTTHALFIPVLYRLAMLSYHTNQPLAYRLNAPTITLAVPPTSGRATEEAGYRLVHDSSAYIPVQRVQLGQLHLDMPTGLTAPGFYKLTKQNNTVATLAINSDRRESELAAYSAAELRQLVGPNHPNVRVLEGGAKPETLARYQAEQAGQPLWRYCLVVVLACLLAEALLLRFGRSRAPAAIAAA
jgi:hypothetical protein